MIEFTNILLGSTLPLHPYLTEHPHLSLKLIADGDTREEMASLNGDLATGIWETNSSLCAHTVKHSVTLAVVATLAIANSPMFQFVSVTISVAELLERVKARPDATQEFTIAGPRSSIQFLMTCLVKVSPSSVIDNSPSQVSADWDDSVGMQGGDAPLYSLLEHWIRPSRKVLEYFYKQAICMPDQDKKAHLLNLLGSKYYALHEETSGLADLDTAISMHEEAMQCTETIHPQLAKHVYDLAVALKRRFRLGWALVDIERAISHYRTALALTADRDAERPRRLNNLGVALQYHFKCLGNLTDLEDAISNQRKAVELTPDGHPERAGWLNNLGIVLQYRFGRLGSLMDLEEAISNNQKAVKLMPDGHANKAACLNNLGISLRSRFKCLGSLTDLEDAILNLRKAVQLTPDGYPDKADLLNSLGISLRSRFERLGSLADLEDAISNLQKAVKLTPDGYPDKANWLNSLGISLLSRFERLGSLTDLEDAISKQRKAIKLTSDDHPWKVGWFNSLGLLFLSRFERLGSLADLEDAISNLRKAVELMPDGHPDNASWLNNLGIALQSRFQRLGSLVDLEDAISNQQMAVKLTPDGHPNKASWLNNLGIALQSRFERHGSLSDLEGALYALSTAAHSTSGPAMVRFKAARGWVLLAEKHSRSPLDAFSCAINLLPQIAWLGLAVTDQHALLADVGDIVRDAVAAAINYEEYETAVIWAEQGRSIVWQNLLGLRSPVDVLREAHPDVADRLLTIAHKLGGSASHVEMPTASAEDVSHSHSKWAIEWDNLIDEIRSIPNFEGFLKAKSFGQLAPAAHEGPVVILNVNDAQCDALVLIPDGSNDTQVSVVNIPLKRVSNETSKNLFRSLASLLTGAGVRVRDARMLKARTHVDGEAKFKDILRILWQDIVKPVLEGLAFQTESKRPRIWWCVTGLLAFLPIHAAGLYDKPELGERISDYVISSYTPTLNAILELAEPVAREGFQVLTVAQASAPGAQPIPETEIEVRIVQRLTDGARRVNLMREDATAERVRQEMTESNWIHLACHGQQNPDDPMESGFLLHDKILKLSEIVKMSLPKADFAFLSACQTAMGDEKVTEESVHLAAGMLLSGCRGVIATTWSIRDEDGPTIAEEVYSRIFKDGKPNRKEAAYALHEAVKRLRESGAQCTSWVPFIHIGR